jgi:hypothetical protein
MIRDRGGPEPLAQLYAVLDVVNDILESDEFQGCIFVNAAMEFPLPHEPAHLAASRYKQAIEEIIYDLAVAAGATSPRDLAREVCLIIEGAYVTRQVTGNRQTIDIARRLARRSIAAHVATATGTTATGAAVPGSAVAEVGERRS